MVYQSWAEVSQLSLSLSLNLWQAGEGGEWIIKLTMKCWDIFTFAVMHVVPLSPRDKQSPGLAWQKSTVTSTSPVKTGFSLIADTAAAGNF